jgi:hypothetical protein
MHAGYETSATPPSNPRTGIGLANRASPAENLSVDWNLEKSLATLATKFALQGQAALDEVRSVSDGEGEFAHFRVERSFRSGQISEHVQEVPSPSKSGQNPSKGLV